MDTNIKNNTDMLHHTGEEVVYDLYFGETFLEILMDY